MSMGGSPLGAVFVAINANVGGLVTGSQLAKAELGSFSRSVGDVQPQLQRLGMTATLVGGAITAMSVGAVAHFGKFEQSMANVGSVLGQTYDEMEELTTLAREWGQTSVFSAREVGQAMYYLASAGFNAQEVVQSLGATLTLAGATMQDLQSTTIMVVAALNAFQLAASEADRVANAMAATISKSQATAEKIGISMRYVAAVANSMGMEIEQVLAALGLLYNAGLEASQAGTALRMSFLKLVGLTPKAAAAVKEMGLAASEVDPMVHSLVEIVEKLSEAGMTPRQAKDIFGARSVAAMMSLISAGSEALVEMGESITGTLKATEMLAIQTDTLQGSMKLLKNAFGEVVLQIGEALAPIIRRLAEGLADLTVWFGNLPKPMKNVFSITGLVVGVLTTLFGIFTLIVTMLPSMIAGWAALGTVMNIALGPIGLISAGIVGLIALFGTLAARSKDSVKRTVDAIEEEAKAMRKIKDKKEALEELAEEYDKLRAKESLTAEEGERFHEVLEMLGKIAPELITAYDSFGRVLDIDRAALKGMTDELAEIHNLRAEINREDWQNELKAIEEKQQARSEALNEALADEKEFAEEKKRLHKIVADAPEGEPTGISVTDIVVVEKAYDDARTSANDLLTEIEGLNAEHTRLRDLLREIQTGTYANMPPTPKPVEALPVDWEAEAQTIEDQENRIRALKIKNIKDEFDSRREAARQQHEEDLELAAASIDQNEALRAAADERYTQEKQKIRDDEVKSEQDAMLKQWAAWQSFMERRRELRENERQRRITAIDEELEKQQEFYYLDEEAYLEYLLRKREAYAEDSLERKAIDEEISELELDRAKKVKREWAQTHASISSGFARSVAGMIVEWDRKVKVFKKIWDTFGKSMVTSFVEKMIRPLTDMLADFMVWAMKELTKLLLKGLGVNLATGGTLGSVKAFKDVASLTASAPIALKTGGYISRGGIARVHRGEQVLSEEDRKLLKLPDIGKMGRMIGTGLLSMMFGKIRNFETIGSGGRNSQTPWSQAGMTRDDFMTVQALSTPDQIVIAPGGILSTDQDSIDEFFTEIWQPAKRRSIEELRDSWGEEM